jgi:hypothetical protein
MVHEDERIPVSEPAERVLHEFRERAIEAYVDVGGHFARITLEP